ncbi:MAG: metallopeptidase TldD-related protein, partial [Spirochaetia bacterium]|nr:metallopeptidase TldD-related protein [Spirochaetia bacterium]
EFADQIPESSNETSWVHFSPVCTKNPAETDLNDLAKKAREIRKAVLDRSEDYIKKVNSSRTGDAVFKPLSEAKVMIRQTVKTHIFIDRAKNMSQTLPVSLVYPMGVASTGHVGRAIVGGLGGLEITDDLGAEDLDLAAVLPHKLSQAGKIQPGRYSVITGPDVTGVIAHEAFGHTQEGDTCMKGRSISVDLRNNQVKVGNDQASIVNYAAVFSMDDLSHGSNGSFFFDHEGQLSRPQTILNQGMLSEPMADLTVSLRLKIPRTANGKRESWRRPLMTRQTNTYFTPGDKTLEEMIGMVTDGFLARYAHGGMEDPKGGSLTAGTEYLEEIKDGKLTGKIFLGPSGGHIELSDPVFTLLDRILAKSRTSHEEGIPENKFGGCGKYHKESVEAGCGGPYILWESVNCG